MTTLLFSVEGLSGVVLCLNLGVVNDRNKQRC
jgi:hypothetical protein